MRILFKFVSRFKHFSLETSRHLLILHMNYSLMII